MRSRISQQRKLSIAGLFAAVFLMSFPSHATDSCNDLTNPGAPVTPHFEELLTPEIHYQVFGVEHAETIVLIHGLDSAGVTFNPIVKELAKKYRVLTYDQRGHGKTPARGTDYSLSVLAKDLLGLVDSLGIQKFHLLGHSYGARTAARFVLNYPDRIKSYIIEDMDLNLRKRPSFATTLPEYEQLAQIPRKFASKEEFFQALSPYYEDETESLYRRRTVRHDNGSVEMLWNPAVSVLYDHFAATDPIQPQLSELTRHPFLLISADPMWGSVISLSGLFNLYKTFPNGEFVTLLGSGHNVHNTRTQTFMKKLLNFLEEVEKQQP